MPRFTPILASVLALLFGCASALPDEAPQLVDMEEPLELFAEPDDEAARQALPLGGFTGVHVGDARDSLDALLGEADGVEVVRVVENSAADAAGLVAGDLLVEARAGDGPAIPLQHPSQWRALENEAAPGDRLAVVVDRAGARFRAELAVVARVRHGERAESERLREEDRVGVVVRTATEVEARAAGLGSGAGAVIVGLSRRSPWRAAGLRYGDLLVEIDGRAVTHPEVLLDAIRAGEDELEIVYVRAGERRQVTAAVSDRERTVREVYVPLIFSRERTRDRTTTSALLGLYKQVRTPAASRYRLLWIFRFGTGDTDLLEEVDG